MLEINCRIHGQHGQHYLNKDEPNSCFVATDTEFTWASMLTMFGRGLRTIFQTMQDSNFIAKFNLKIPTFMKAKTFQLIKGEDM